MGNLQDQLTSSLSGAYTIERELGGGGMSRVFLAEDSRLRRKVVVKVLSPELAAGISADRFEREIQLAASMLQANIVPVLSTGESHGLPYYTMPFVDGESLRSRIQRDGGIPLSEVPGIIRDVARALAYAHERGVVHRDIKPDNVLLSGGAAVVTDFGIAKAIAAARGPVGATLTQMGTSIGTPAYMAPEQAAGDPDADHRADIYALGCMMYELLAGQLPFPNRTPQRMLAAHMGEAPRPILEVAPATPAALAALVMSCLEKDPAARPQSAREVIRALDAVASGTSNDALNASLLARPGLLKWALAIYIGVFVVVAILAKAATLVIGLPDWVFPGSMIVMALGLPVLLFTGYSQAVVRRAALATPAVTPGGRTRSSGTMAEIAVKASPHLTWKRAAIGGALALGLFVVAIGSFMGLRSAGIGRFGSLAKRLGDARILIGDFRATSTDTALGNVVTEAVRADLAQSSAVTILSPSAVSTLLRTMQKAPGTKLDTAVAREVAIRAGLPGFVAGEITGLGNGFVVNVRLVGTDSGQALASYSEVANSPQDLIPTIGKITRKLRDKMGESLKHLQASPQLADVMTPSLPALRVYTEGLTTFRAGEFARSLRLFEQAIAIDSSFGAAYRSAATAIGNMGTDPERELRFATKAFELSDRLPDAERYQTRATYYGRTDPEKAIPEWEAMARVRPTSSIPHNNAAIIDWEMRRYESAEQRLRRGISADSLSPQPQSNLILTLLEQGKLAQAESALHRMRRRFPAHPMTAAATSQYLVAEQEFDSAAAYLEQFVDRGGDVDPSLFVAAGSVLASTYAVQGRLEKAEQLQHRVSDADKRGGGTASEPIEKAIVATIDAWYRGNRAKALRGLADAETLSTKVHVANRPYDLIAMGYGLAGAPDKARTALAQFRRQKAPQPSQTQIQTANAIESLIAYSEGRYADGIRSARMAEVGACSACALPFAAMNFDMAGQADSAIVTYRRFVQSTSTLGPREDVNALFLTGSYKRLAELLEAKGDTKGAIENYEQALRLWKNADGVLQPQVADMRRRVDRLRRAGG